MRLQRPLQGEVPARTVARGELGPRNWPLELGRRGFRLPTDRSGKRPAVPDGTAYGFGSDASLLGQFGWFAENSGKHGHPPRELSPSIRGLLICTGTDLS